MIQIFTFLGGIYFFLEFLLPKEFFGFSFAPYHEFITNGFLATGVTAIGLGLISILRVHGVRVLKGGSGRVSSGLLLVAMLAMIIVTSREAILSSRDAKLIERAGLLREFATIVHDDPQSDSKRVEIAFTAIADFNSQVSALPSSANAAYEDLKTAQLELKKSIDPRSRERLIPASQALSQIAIALRAYQEAHRELSVNRGIYNLLYQGLWTSLAAAMFSLLGFYIAAAAYRAFRIRSVESGLMMIAAVIVMLGQIPFGVWISESLPELRGWLLSVPSSAAFRAIRIGAGVAALLMAIRMWLSLDKKGGAI